MLSGRELTWPRPALTRTGPLPWITEQALQQDEAARTVSPSSKAGSHRLWSQGTHALTPARLCRTPVAQIPGVKLEETRSLQPRRDASTPQIVLVLQTPSPSTKQF